MLEDVGTSANNIIQLDSNGKIPAVDGSLLTGVDTSLSAASDPTISTNPSGGVGTKYKNTTSGEIYICTDATAGSNVWTNVGPGSGNIVPIAYIGNRGIFSGGYESGNRNEMDYIAIPTLGNATDFGDLTSGVQAGGGCSNSNRGLIGGGQVRIAIDYITIATPGNAADFGDLVNGTSQWYGPASSSNGTRGVFGGGVDASIKQPYIDYVTIVTLGNSIDFGNLTITRSQSSSCASLTRSLFLGGRGATDRVNTIDYITTATIGNAVDFGDLTVARNGAACSNLTRGVLSGGRIAAGGGTTNVIDYVTMATTGNATDFGDLTRTDTDEISACANRTRATMAGGYGTPYSNIIDYFTIDTPGNAVDFGDLTVARSSASGLSGD